MAEHPGPLERFQLHVHQLEHVPLCFPSHERTLEDPAVAGAWIEAADFDEWVLGDVPGCLAEKLERQRDVRGIDVENLGNVYDVRLSVSRAARKDARQGALHGCFRLQRDHSTRLPASGPGVCSYTSSI